MKYDIVPYTSVFIDAGALDLLKAAERCLFSKHLQREETIDKIQNLFVTSTNPNRAMVLLSVRTAFDLFCEVMRFPQGSEIIMTAINIPSMAAIAEHHGLHVVPLDIDLETLSPDPERLECLVNAKTVAFLVAHIYGSVIDIEPLLRVAKAHNLIFVEDCAESFNGFEYLGHPESDISIFSFGVIKFRTAFGGAVAKIRDQEVYEKMLDLHNRYELQSGTAYLKKIIKYSGIYCLLNMPTLIKPGMMLFKTVGYDYKSTVVNWLRNFQGPEFFQNLRFRPSTAMVETMYQRLHNVDAGYFKKPRVVANYAQRKLPIELTRIGSKVNNSTYWLFPVLVPDAEKFTDVLNSMGIDAYRGSTQLNVIEPKEREEDIQQEQREISLILSSHLPKTSSSRNHHQTNSSVPLTQLCLSSSSGNNYPSTPPDKYPHQSKYLIDHVVYLPIHKNVPFNVIDTICKSINEALKVCDDSNSMKSKL